MALNGRLLEAKKAVKQFKVRDLQNMREMMGCVGMFGMLLKHQNGKGSTVAQLFFSPPNVIYIPYGWHVEKEILN